jgi:hypothetical protein
MVDDPTEAMIRREVDAARRIIREDKIIGKLNRVYPDEPPADPEGQPPVPPKKDPAEPPVRKGLWWGEPK